MLPASASSSPFTATMSSQVGDSHSPPPLMAPRSLPIGSVGIDHPAQVGDGLAQPRRVDPAGGLEQHRFRLEFHVVSKLAGAVSDQLGMGG
jgi:hypothetical protein